MKFGMTQEALTSVGSNHYRRYHEVVREVQAAEAAGFDFWGTSEQHFVSPHATVTAPEVLYGYVAAHTNRIRIRHMVVLLPFAFNHPIRVAERIATLDIVSRGRAELGIGRSNQLLQLEGFGVDPKESRAELIEALDVIGKALTQKRFSHEGPKLSIPPRELSPRAVQVPHPPLSGAGTSHEMARLCGEKGIGLMFADTFLGWDYLKDGIDEYRKGLSQVQPVTGHVNDTLAICAFSAHCSESIEEAKRVGGVDAFRFLRGVSHIYSILSEQSDDYAYMSQVKELKDHGQDIDFLREKTSSIVVGTPDDFIERVRKCQELGAEEVIWRIEGAGHEETMKTIDLIGRYVIPEFKNPDSIIREMGHLRGPIP